MSEATTKATDEQIRTTVESIRDPDTVPAFSNGYYTLTPDELRRAILALRPAVEPMTDVWTMDDIEQACVMAEVSPAQFESIALWLETEGRGITAKAEDAHQPTKEAE